MVSGHDERLLYGLRFKDLEIVRLEGYERNRGMDRVSAYINHRLIIEG